MIVNTHQNSFKFRLTSAVLLLLAASLGPNMAKAEDQPANEARPAPEDFWGRWTVSDDKPVFSSKGKIYKTIDLAPCGKDYCGISVSDKGECGPTLFRFLVIHMPDMTPTGHGIWGDQKKKVQISYYVDADQGPKFGVSLGDDDMDITGREGSLPKFEAGYKKTGKAACTLPVS